MTFAEKKQLLYTASKVMLVKSKAHAWGCTTAKALIVQNKLTD